MRTVSDNIKADADSLSRQIIRAKMPPAKMVHAELCHDLKNAFYTWAWSKNMIPAGTAKDYIKSLNFTTCKRSEATHLLTVGEQTEAGCFITGQYKNYYLKAI